MATVLQQQLAAIHATKSSELDLKAQKLAHAQSLLFEPAVASTQSFEVLYPICRDGFEELCAVDSRFFQYASTLFSPHSKTQDRNVLNKLRNKDLNKHLENFLRQVSAFVLLKPAQKAIEWLIRRFRVHELNTELLVLSFLPYYQNDIFLTLLSILPAKFPSSIKHLQRYANSKSNPPISALVDAATQNRAFLLLLNRFILHMTKSNCHYQNLVSIWASIVTQAVERLVTGSKSAQKELQRQRHEDLLTEILPTVSEALYLKHAPEIVIGCHLVIVILVRKTELDGRTLDAILDSLSQRLTLETSESALACISLIASQRTGYFLPNRVWGKVIRLPSLNRHLKTLSLHQNVHSLATGLALGVMKRMGAEVIPNGAQLIETLFCSQLLLESELELLLNSFTVALRENVTYSTTAKHKIQKQLQHVERIVIEARSSSNYDQEAPSPQPSLLMDKGAYEQSKSPANHRQIGFDNSKGPLPEDDAELSQWLATLGNESFLSLSTKLPFTSLIRMFESAVPSTQMMEEFLQHPLLDRQQKHSSILFFSFLARVWCASGSAIARAIALEVMSDQVDHFRTPSHLLSLIIPYLFVALADKAIRVRRNAATVILALSKLGTEKTGATMASNVFYGERIAELKQLSPEDASELINSCLEPELEECVSDARHVGRVFGRAVGDIGPSTSPIERRRLKKSHRSTIFSSLSSHVLLTNCANARLNLLKLLNTVNRVSGKPRSQFLLPCLQAYVADIPQYSAQCENERVNLAELRSELFKTVHCADEDALRYLLNLATGDSTYSKDGVHLPAFQRIYILWPRLRLSFQKWLTLSLFHVAQSADSGQYTSIEASKLLRSVQAPGEVVTDLIEEILDSQSIVHEDLSPNKRRSETGERIFVGNNKQLNGNFLSKLTFSMEIAENAEGKANVKLLQTIFRVLQELQFYRMRADSDLSYLTDVTLSLLSDTLQVLNSECATQNIISQTIRPDLLADCVRQTNSPQTRNSALTVLSSLARQFPQEVLHSVMPIFTMMSNTITRISDDFSADVVDQTIRHVVPVVVNKFHAQKKDLVAAVAEILLSFAISFDHIPPHRRIQMYSLLAHSLGAEDSLFAIIVTLSDRFAANTDVLKFIAALFRNFESGICLTTVQRILELTIDGMDPVPSLFPVLIKQDSHDGSLDISCLNLIRTAVTLIKDPSFQAGLGKELSLEESRASKLEQSLQETFVNAVRLSSHASEELKSPTILLMDELLSIFPFEAMAACLKTFMGHADDAVRICLLTKLERIVMRNEKLSTNARLISLSLLEHLTPILENSSGSRVKALALACIDLICERFGKADYVATLSAVRVVSSKSCLGSDDITIQTLAFHCLASAVLTLKNDFIPLLGSSESAACSAWPIAISKGEERLQNSIVAFSISVFDNLPFMVSENYLCTALKLAEESAVAGFNEGARDNRIQMYKLIGSKISLPLLARVVCSGWQRTVQQGPLALHESMNMVQSLADSRTRSEIALHSREVFTIFHEVLDLRVLSATSSRLDSAGDVDEFELQIIKALTSIVLKVNDATFRPFFVRLADWSSQSTDLGGHADTLRSITFFNVLFGISSRLKSLFTGYFAYVLNHACQILSEKSSPKSLKGPVLRALSSSFENDQDDFWQAPSRFDVMLPSLISCLSDVNMQPLYIQLNATILEFAAAANSPEHYKTLNEQLLKLCRVQESQIKLSVVNLQQHLTEKLGDEWLSNLPEMLPVINELQEDDNEAVEKETRKWIKAVENNLGQSLHPMLQ